MQGMVRGEIKNIELVAQSIKKAVEAIERSSANQNHGGLCRDFGWQHIRCVKYPYYVFVGRDEIREEDVQKLHESMANVQAPDGETIIQIIPQSYIVDDEETPSPRGFARQQTRSDVQLRVGRQQLGEPHQTGALSGEYPSVRSLYLNAIASAEAVTTE